MQISCNIMSDQSLDIVICEEDGFTIKSAFRTFLCEDVDFEELRYSLCCGDFQKVFCKILEYIFDTASTNTKRLEEFNSFFKVFRDNEREIMGNFFQKRIDELLEEVRGIESKKEDNLSFYDLQKFLEKEIEYYSKIIYREQRELEEIKENTKSYEDKTREIKYYENKIKELESAKNTISNEKIKY